MKIKIVPLPIVLLAFVFGVSGQVSTPVYSPPDPMVSISIELSNISRSVQQLSERMKTFLDKFEKGGGATMTDKQQRFIMSLDLLVRSEQRVATLQKAHTELIEKHVQIKTRLTQIELDIKPQNIEQATIFEGGSSQAPEFRENRRNKLIAEQRSLVMLIQQIERNIAETESGLREAQSHVARLRRSLLPQIEREVSEAAY